MQTEEYDISMHFISLPSLLERQRLAAPNGDLRRGAHMPYVGLETVGG